MLVLPERATVDISESERRLVNTGEKRKRDKLKDFLSSEKEHEDNQDKKCATDRSVYYHISEGDIFHIHPEKSGEKREWKHKC